MSIFIRFSLICFSIALWSAQAQWYPGDDGLVQWAYNCDFNAVDIGSFRSRGEDCGRLCFRQPRCTRFTWTNDGTCHFKAGVGESFYRGHGNVCGYVVAEKNKLNGITWLLADQDRIRWALNCDITGPDVEVRKTIGENCGPVCLSREDCIGFVWTKYDGGTCWLKSSGYPIVAHSGVGGVCGEIISRRAPLEASVRPSDRTKRKSELACRQYTDIASHYRIRRGDSAQRSEFPWMAALAYRIEKRIQFDCGGTIISDYFVLTAAHCVEPEPEYVQLGTHILSNSDKKNYEVESCIQHEQFSPETYENDIAVVKLEQRITFSNKILPACLLANRNDLHSSRELVVTGWDHTGEVGTSSNILRKANLKTVNLKTCQADFLRNGSEPKDRIDESQYCAADPDRNIDACRGDSGGPLQTFNSSPLATVVGVVSFGKGCPSQLPGIYTRVAFFLDWIENKVWED